MLIPAFFVQSMERDRPRLPDYSSPTSKGKEEGLGLLPRAIGYRVRVGKSQVLEALSKSAKPGARSS